MMLTGAIFKPGKCMHGLLKMQHPARRAMLAVGGHRGLRRFHPLKADPVGGNLRETSKSDDKGNDDVQ
jgi:hypothetical protein